MASTAFLCLGTSGGTSWAGIRHQTGATGGPWYPSTSGEGSTPQLRTIEIMYYVANMAYSGRWLFSCRRASSTNTMFRAQFTSTTIITTTLRDNAGFLLTVSLTVPTLTPNVWYHYVLMPVVGTGWVTWNGRLGRDLAGNPTTRDSFPFSYASSATPFSATANNRLDGFRISNTVGMNFALAADVTSGSTLVANSFLPGGVAEFRAWTSSSSESISGQPLLPLTGADSVDDLRDQFVDGTTFPSLVHCFRLNEPAGTAVNLYDDVGTKNAAFTSEVANGGFASNPIATTQVTGSDTITGGYKARTTPDPPTMTGGYKVLKTTTPVINGVYKVRSTPTAPTLDGGYKIFASPSETLTGSYRLVVSAFPGILEGAYKIITTPTAPTLTGDYKVRSTPTAPTLTGAYKIIQPDTDTILGGYEIIIPTTSDTGFLTGSYRIAGGTFAPTIDGGYRIFVEDATQTLDGSYKIRSTDSDVLGGGYVVVNTPFDTLTGGYRVTNDETTTLIGAYKVLVPGELGSIQGGYRVLDPAVGPETLTGGYKVATVNAPVTLTGGYAIVGPGGTTTHTAELAGSYRVYNADNAASVALRKLAALRQRTR